MPNPVPGAWHITVVQENPYREISGVLLVSEHHETVLDITPPSP
jgi:hypothetical protein